MDQNIEQQYSSKSKANIKVKMRETNSEEKSNKYSQFAYASSRANNFGTHMKLHSGEKLNKCNQCNYASSKACNLREH